jgi:hypothetical protein
MPRQPPNKCGDPRRSPKKEKMRKKKSRPRPLSWTKRLQRAAERTQDNQLIEVIQ